MDALDVIIENQGWAPNVTLGLLRRFINGRGLMPNVPGFFRTSPTLRMMERRLPIFQWSPDQTDKLCA